VYTFENPKPGFTSYGLPLSGPLACTKEIEELKAEAIALRKVIENREKE